MTGTHLFRTTAEIEDTAGVDRIDELLAQRHAIVQELARLRPLYGPLGMFGHRRKIELARLTVQLLAEATKDGGKKPTDTVLDALAHEHDDYVSMIAQATTEAARWVELEESLEAIDMRVNRGQALLRYASSEPRQ
jgi:hypothetical protein